MIARIPAGRLGGPWEVARVVEFLADPDSTYINGQIYGRTSATIRTARSRSSGG